jgi:ribosomal protein L29
MKITKIKNELKNLPVDQLLARREIISKELFNLRLQAKSGHIKDNALLGKMRKLIARINTFIAQKSNFVA